MNEKSCRIAVPSLLVLLSLAPACYAVDEPAESSAAESTGAQDPTGGVETTSESDGPGLPGTDGDPTASEETGMDGSTSGDSTSDGAGESTGDGETGDPPTGDETGTAAPPTIVEMTPEDGALGVAADQIFTVRFSEVMDKAATQAAYQSADIPAGAVTFSWNEIGDELSITPNDLLPYAEGIDPASTVALTYGFTISSAAEAESGLSLEDDMSASFSTLRRLSPSFNQDTELSGRVRDLGGATLLAGVYGLGDTSVNDVGRGFVSFDISSLPEGALTVEDAVFHAQFSQVQGNPFVDLGAVVYQQVSYDSFGDALFDTAGIGSASGLFGTINEDEADRDVTDIATDVLDDPKTFGHRVQFKMQWAFNETDGDSQTDGVSIVAGSSRLDLRLLAP